MKPLTRGVFLDIATVDSGDLDRSRLLGSLDHWDWFQLTKPEQIAERSADVNALLTNKCRISRSVIESSPGLKLIALSATGTDNVDLNAASDHGVAVCNIRDYCTGSVAQHVITLTLNLLTGLPWYIDDVRRGEWSKAVQFCLKDRPIREACGLTFGVIGYGTLGRQSAVLAKALGMNVLVAERKGAQPRGGRVAFDEVVERSDVLSIHCPLTDETRGMINADVFRAMKQDAYLINTARGAVIAAEDLADALRAGEIAGAGVDTLDVEPPPADHPLLASDIPNLIVTPHNAWGSKTARQAALDHLANIVNAFQAGKPINVVNNLN
ncbi:MAG TPA: D-2-hydroxyacid dehydrogenase [Xanthomonadales bacterium]|nr:D-2-hydroxyacid dehydrogenase [Xanthomonadales bacterium]